MAAFHLQKKFLVFSQRTRKMGINYQPIMYSFRNSEKSFAN